MKMFSPLMLFGSAHAPSYVSVHIESGDRVEVNGRVMVDLGHNCVDAALWTSSKAEAHRIAAAKIRAVCDAMLKAAEQQDALADQAVIDANRKIKMPIGEGMKRTLD